MQGYCLQQTDVPEDAKGIKVYIHSKVVNWFLQLWYYSDDGGDKGKIVNIGVCPFIRDKGDKRKSELCNLRDGLQLYANK